MYPEAEKIKVKSRLIKKGYIPYDKSWMIRMGVLDLINGYDASIRFLKKNEAELGEDLKSSYRAFVDWREDKKKIYVGDSGTLYRFLKYASWKLGLKKEFEFNPEGTLMERSKEMCNNPKIINYSLEKLLTLDHHTSQWASAAVLMGCKEKVADIENPPYKLKVTDEAVKHWEERRSKGLHWLPRYDDTILEQAVTFLEILKDNSMPYFEPKQAEDYCFARAFEYITKEEGEKRWPSLRGHESDRIEEMEKEMEKIKSIGGRISEMKSISSKDPRVIEGCAMRQQWSFYSAKADYRDFVNKNWPQFWRFLGDSENLK